ncbi:glycoside hydrolase family 108 protein, partial [Klebsiella pneumoniae]
RPGKEPGEAARTFSLVTLGRDKDTLKKGDRVWVVSDGDSLTPVTVAASGNEPVFNDVYVPSAPVPVSAGDSLGHMGFYQLPEENGKRSRYQVHIECLSMNDMEKFITNPGHAGEDAPVYLTWKADAPLLEKGERGMVAGSRKTKISGILTLAKVPGVDAEGNTLSGNQDAAYYQIRPEGGWLPAASVKKVSQYALGELGFVTLNKAPESFDLIDGIKQPNNVVKGILEQLYKAAQDETRTTHALNKYNYKRLLELIDSNQDGYYQEQEYLQAVHNISYRDRLYRVIAKHASEWYYGKDAPLWKTYLDTLTRDAPLWKTYLETFLDKMTWMKTVSEKGVALGSEPWHMHPVVFLEAIRIKERCRELFSKISSVILQHEGGYVNDPNDRGGETNMGITIATWRAYAPSDLGIEATTNTLRNMTKEQAEIIYYNHYWEPKGFCKLETIKIALMLYDWTITSGRAVTQVRKMLHNEYNINLVVSNTMDDDMIHCINAIEDQEQLLSRIAEVRKEYYRSLTITNGEPNTQVRFLTGWINRVNDCLRVNI